MDLSLGVPATLALAALVLIVGRLVIERVGFLQKYSIPDPVVGGLIAALLVAALHAMGVRIAFDTALQPGLMLAFFATIGLGGDTAYKAGFGTKGDQLASLVRVTRSGNVHEIADLLAYEQAHNPAGGVKESDPYGILRRDDASIVADAGANDLLKVTDRGRISTLAVFPPRMIDFQGEKVPMDAVPTTVVRGPDGAYYVGQLTGFPFPRHGARVFRVAPGGKPTVWARGFTNIIDMAFHDGTLYVLEIAHNSLATSGTPFGALLRLNPDGSKTVLDKDLSFPTSLAFVPGSDDVLVTNCGICAGGGEVLRIEL